MLLGYSGFGFWGFGLSGLGVRAAGFRKRTLWEPVGL